MTSLPDISQQVATDNNKQLSKAHTPDDTTSLSPLHIVLVTETWHPDVNGVAMSLYQLMSEIVRLGHKVSLIRPTLNIEKNINSSKHTNTNTNTNTHHNNDQLASDKTTAPQSPIIEKTVNIIFEEILVKGLPIPRYPDLQFGTPAYGHIKQCLKKLTPDVVHIATEGPLGLATLAAAKRLRIPVSTGYHTQFHDFSKHFGFGIIAKPLLIYFKWFHNWSDATCVPSQKTEADLTKLGFERISQVGRGVDTERFNPLRRSQSLRDSWEAKQHHTVLVMVSRLSPEKGVDVVIKAFKALQGAQMQRATKLVIVGDGPDRARLESLAASGGDDIIFTGSKTGTDLAEHYASGDAFVFASQVETFGNVVTEAMASGLPIFAFDDAAAGLLVTKATGDLVPMGDKQAFIDMIASLPKMQTLHQQGQDARHSVKGFSWQRPSLQMLAMFNGAISRHTQRSTKQTMIEQIISNLNGKVAKF